MGKSIDLSYKVTDWEKLDAMRATSAPEPSKPLSDDEKPKKVVYPNFYISEAPPEMGDIPADGFALVKYHVRERTVSDREGEKSARMEIEVHSFAVQPGKGGKTTKPSGALEEKSADAAFDEAFADAADA